MAEETERRIQSIMEKLIQAPKSKLSLPSSTPNMRGQKRPYSALEPKSMGDNAQPLPNGTPQCRPWDRGDLFKRLATFKSLTWFAKPKVVDAISCARRGWVNVDMDIIACEVCGARLMFSTPSSWNRQQVEKASLVFSLKLDNGHKLLCPWIDNICDEALGRFPPTPTPVLVDHYRERCSTLLQLSGLPKVSSSAFEHMRSPELEHFLKQSIAVECGDASSWTDSVGGDDEAISAGFYYQAHRLLSLCGWEPRQLPYMVDCGDKPQRTTYDVGSSSQSHEKSGGHGTTLTVYSSSGENGKRGVNIAHSTARYDPNSAVLDCKLCGASIGLWTFLTVPRPLELVRIVGYADVNGNNTDVRSAETSSSKVHLPGLNLTIAGGPPPTKQNYKATISLPVIGRNLRARFSSELIDERTLDGEGSVTEKSGVEGQRSFGAESQCNSSREDTGGFHDSSSDIHVQVTGCPSAGSDRNDGITDAAASGDLLPINEMVSKEQSSSPTVSRNVNGCQDTSQAPLDMDLRRLLSDNSLEFDPVKQHRHFCPWVAATNASAPGWMQTLLALQKEQIFTLKDSEDPPSSPSLIKIDDPITSIRNLFKSPTAKRLKLTHG